MNVDEAYESVRDAVEAGTYDFEKCATRLDRDGPYHLEDVLAAILSAEGNLSAAARLLGRQRQRLRDYINRNPEILDFIEDFTEGRIDLIEQNFMKAAVNGDLGAAWKVLSTKGRNRGYGNQITAELVGAGGGPIRTISREMTPQEAAEAYAATLKGEGSGGRSV